MIFPNMWRTLRRYITAGYNTKSGNKNVKISLIPLGAHPLQLCARTPVQPLNLGLLSRRHTEERGLVLSNENGGGNIFCSELFSLMPPTNAANVLPCARYYSAMRKRINAAQSGHTANPSPPPFWTVLRLPTCKRIVVTILSTNIGKREPLGNKPTKKQAQVFPTFFLESNYGAFGSCSL